MLAKAQTYDQGKAEERKNGQDRRAGQDRPSPMASHVSFFPPCVLSFLHSPFLSFLPILTRHASWLLSSPQMIQENDRPQRSKRSFSRPLHKDPTHFFFCPPSFFWSD